MVVEFLNSPPGFGEELRRRQGVSNNTGTSLCRELQSLEKQHREEQEAEARAFRLASRGAVSEEVFRQEVGLIRTNQLWLTEQRKRVEDQILEVQRYTVDPQNIELLRQRLGARLAPATPEDREFVFDALGVKVLVGGDGSWELELEVPRGIPEPDKDFQIVNNRPRSGVHYLKTPLAVRLPGK
jgi:hypothetical protein